jgi:hypothetical protein
MHTMSDLANELLDKLEQLNQEFENFSETDAAVRIVMEYLNRDNKVEEILERRHWRVEYHAGSWVVLDQLGRAVDRHPFNAGGEVRRWDKPFAAILEAEKSFLESNLPSA